MSIAGVSLLASFVEVFDSTFGHKGAFVSAASNSINSVVNVLLSFAASVRLQRVIEKPGPFREVSNVPEYILVGLISQIFSARVSVLFELPSHLGTYLIVTASPRSVHLVQGLKDHHNY